MSLATTTRKAIANGNGVTTSWPYTFPILQASHLSVIVTDSNGVETTLLTSQYGVTGIGGVSGGAVTYPLSGSPLAAGSTITLLRTVPFTQGTILSNQGGYYPEVLEAALDLVYMALQQHEERLAASVRAPATDDSPSMILPGAADRAGGIVGFDDDGDLEVLMAAPTATTSSWIANNLLNVATQALARTALDVPGNAEAVLKTLVDAAGDLIVGSAADTPARLAKGANLSNLRVNGSGALEWGSHVARITVHTGSATHTPNANMLWCLIEAQGAGGGGGGTADTNANIASAGAGGGAGSLARKIVTAAAFGASQAVTIGAAGASGNNAGSAGGDSSVGALCIGKGGSGGGGAAGGAGGFVVSGGLGGIAGTGDDTPTGAPGEGTWSSLIQLGFARSGAGGSSRFGGGGRAKLLATNTNAAGEAGTGHGSGGSGGASYSGGGAAAGGAGTAGKVVIVEFCSA